MPALQQQLFFQKGPGYDAGLETYQQLFNTLQGFKQQAHKELDIRARKEGLKAGREAALGKVDDVVLPEGGTISADAFREGANMSHMAAVKLDIAENMARIKAEAGNDVMLFQAKVEGYRKGLLNGTTEDVRPLAFEEIEVLGSKLSSEIRSHVAKLDRDEQAAQVESGLELLETELLNAALNGSEADMVRTNAQYRFMLEKAENAELIPAGDTIRRTDEIYKKMNENVYIGSFDAALENNRGVEFLETFVDTKDKTMKPADKEALLSTMITRMNRRQSLENEQDEMDKKVRTEAYRNTERDVTLQALEGTLVPETLINHLKNDTIQPSFARTMEKVSKAQGVSIDDDQVKFSYAVDLLAVDEHEIATDERLTRDTRLQLIVDRRKLEEDAGDWRRSQNGSEAVRRIKAEFGMVDGLIAQLDPEKAKRAGRALTTLYEQVENLPLEERAVKAIDLSDEIIRKLNLSDMQQDLRDMKEGLNKLQYRSSVELDQAIEAGDVGGHEAKVLRRKIQNYESEIQRLERETAK
jgi:hypothetical protein